jgi:hypothetical protein
MRWYFVLVTSALVLAALSGVGLAWDGAYTLFSILDSQSPQVSYGRFTQIPLHWLVVQASGVTNDLTVLRTAFGLVYAASTLLALVASWWILRSQGESRPLFVWAALGIGLGTLPGQACAVCQAVTCVQLFYPILLAILIRMPRRTIPVVAFLAVAIFFLHESAIPLFALGAGVAVLVALQGRGERRSMFRWALALAGLSTAALLRFLLFHSPYQAGELSLQVLVARFYQSVAGLPIGALALAWLGAALILLQPWWEDPFQSANKGFFFSLASLSGAGVLLIIWASDSRRWIPQSLRQGTCPAVTARPTNRPDFLCRPLRSKRQLAQLDRSLAPGIGGEPGSMHFRRFARLAARHST